MHPDKECRIRTWWGWSPQWAFPRFDPIGPENVCRETRCGVGVGFWHSRSKDVTFAIYSPIMDFAMTGVLFSVARGLGRQMQEVRLPSLCAAYDPLLFALDARY